MNRFLALLTLFLVLPAISLMAQDATDDASDTVYNDGWQNGDNGGANFSAGWLVSASASTPPADVAEALVQDAASVGGDAVMNTGGRAWIIHTNEGGTNASVQTRRFFSSLPDGGKIQFRLQATGDHAGTSNSIDIRDGASQTLVRLSPSSGNWEIITLGLVDSGISAASPIEVLITHDAISNEFDIRLSELIAPNAVFSATDQAYVAPGNPDNFTVTASDANSNDTYLLINNLTVNPDGSLPAEISSFELE